MPYKSIFLFIVLLIWVGRSQAHTLNDVPPPQLIVPAVVAPNLPLSVYYDSTAASVEVEFATRQSRCRVIQTDMYGQLVQRKVYKGKQRLPFNLKGDQGIYFVFVYRNNVPVAVFRVMKW